jgi:hypothetical protein
MAIKKRTIKQFELEFQKRLIDRREFYIQNADTLFLRKRMRFEFNFKLALNDEEKEHLIKSELATSRNLLNQHGIVQILSIFELNDPVSILKEIEELSDETFEIIHESELLEMIELSNEQIDVSTILDETLKLEVRELDKIIVDVLSRKRYFEFLAGELETFNTLQQPYIPFDSYLFEENLPAIEQAEFDSSMIKWNRLNGDFYFFIDALEQSKVISFTENNKTVAVEQIARCFGLELASSWETSKSDDYKKENIKYLDCGKTSIFSDMKLAFERIVERRDKLNNAKDERATLTMQEVKDKIKQK